MERRIEMADLWDAFLAFNQNSFSHIIYALSNSLWFVLIILAAVVSIVLMIKDKVTVTVREEQQVI